MIDSVLKIDRVRLDALPGINSNDQLTNLDRAHLTEFHELMSYFAEATDRIQGIIKIINDLHY